MSMPHSPVAIIIFLIIVGLVLGLSFYMGRSAKSSAGYYAAGGNIHWFVNGIAFAGDYLSAASFLGICGMIATAGYDGFIYSIGYLAGWMVALFLVAEPMKRLGKFTFTDALDSKFSSKGIQLAAAISTLVVSIFYLIPQMVGAGVLIQPLLGLPHWAGVIMVGIIVTIVVATAGMASTTYVQFLKGAMLIVFSTILVVALFSRGFSTKPQNGLKAQHEFATLVGTVENGALKLSDATYTADPTWETSDLGKAGFVNLQKNGVSTYFHIAKREGTVLTLAEAQSEVLKADGSKLINGLPAKDKAFHQVGTIAVINGDQTVAQTGGVGPFEFLSTLRKSTVVLWGSKSLKVNGEKVTIHYQKPTLGSKVLRPGLKYKLDGAKPVEKADFISLMLALFLGTASLPHILIRYYTVPSPKDARKSTIVAIASIGFFYVLTLFLGLGAMVNGVVNLLDNNMSAPLLAYSFGIFLFAAISALAFATVLGTVSGLIVAASGAVAHDLMDRFMDMRLSDSKKVMAGKLSAVAVGILAMFFGIMFEGTNVSFLVGWAFAVAASANLPAILMLLFWKRTTAQGIVASILVGITSALGIILLSPDMFKIYGKLPQDAPFSFNNPALFSVPLSVLALIVVSLMTKSPAKDAEA